MSKFALFGATGVVGQSIAQVLRQDQHAYRVVGRNGAALQSKLGSDPLAEVVTWDPDDPASIRAAARGADTLIYLVGVPYHRFDLHPILMRKTVEAAIAEGVPKILLIGTVYPYGKPQATPVTENHPRAPHTFKGRMRKEQEDVLLEADAAGKIRAAILRLPDFYGPRVQSSFLHSVFEAAAGNKTADLVGPIDTPHEFVFVPDIGPVVLALAQREEAWGHWWHFAGPGAITEREAAECAFAIAGRKPKLRVAGKNTLRLLGLFNPLMREFVEMNYLFTTPVLMDDSALRLLLGNLKKTPYEEGIRVSVQAAQAEKQR